MINFDISGLQDNTGSRILLTQYFNILSFIWTQVISDESDTRKQIYADEYGVIMDPELQEVMKYFASISRRIRKRIGGLTVATQQISDVLKPEVKSEGQVIINQSCYQFFFNIAGETEYFKGTKNSSRICIAIYSVCQDWRMLCQVWNSNFHDNTDYNSS